MAKLSRWQLTFFFSLATVLTSSNHVSTPWPLIPLHYRSVRYANTPQTARLRWIIISYSCGQPPSVSKSQNSDFFGRGGQKNWVPSESKGMPRHAMPSIPVWKVRFEPHAIYKFEEIFNNSEIHSAEQHRIAYA